MFDRFPRWQSAAESPTLFRVQRPVLVNPAAAFPGVAGSINLAGVPLGIRAGGLAFEPFMEGQQVAWFRCHNGNYIAVVELTAHSANRRSEVDMQLWLPPNAFQVYR